MSRFAMFWFFGSLALLKPSVAQASSCVVAREFLRDGSSPKTFEQAVSKEPAQTIRQRAATAFKIMQRRFIDDQMLKIDGLDLVAMAKVRAVSAVQNFGSDFDEFNAVYARVNLEEVFKAPPKRQWLGKLRGNTVDILLAPQFKVGQTILLKASAVKAPAWRIDAGYTEAAMSRQRIWSSGDACGYNENFVSGTLRYATLLKALRQQKRFPHGKGYLVVTKNIELAMRPYLEKQSGQKLREIELDFDAELEGELEPQNLLELRPGTYVMRWPNVPAYAFEGCSIGSQFVASTRRERATRGRDVVENTCRGTIQSHRTLVVEGIYRKL